VHDQPRWGLGPRLFTRQSSCMRTSKIRADIMLVQTFACLLYAENLDFYGSQGLATVYSTHVHCAPTCVYVHVLARSQVSSREEKNDPFSIRTCMNCVAW
jgi:hypothetical protein